MLDGFRGLAVLLVMFFHGALDHVPGGFLGVDLFFVLSGFLITTLLLEEWERHGTISLRGFYARRVRRLLPALVLLVLLGGLLEWVFADMRGTQPYVVGAVGSLFYVNNWVMVWDGHALRTLSPTWSLAVEEQFYLLWPLTLLLLLRRRVRPARLLLVAGSLVTVSLLFMVVVARAYPSHNIYMSSVPRAGELAVGVMLSVLWRQGWLPGLLRSRFVPLVPMAGLVVLSFNAHVKSSTWLYTWGVLFAAALCAGVLLASSLEQPTSMVARLFQVRFLRFTGKISYGLYLYNFPMDLLFDPHRTGLPLWPSVALRLAAAYAVAVPSWYLVESRFLRRRPRPARELLRRGQVGPRCRRTAPGCAGARTGRRLSRRDAAYCW